MDATTKTGINDARTASKRVVQKPEEATWDLIRNRIADKITSVSKKKLKKKKMKQIKDKQSTYHQKNGSKLKLQTF